MAGIGTSTVLCAIMLQATGTLVPSTDGTREYHAHGTTDVVSQASSIAMIFMSASMLSS